MDLRSTTLNNKTNLEKEVAWASQNMPRTLRQVAALPDLSGVRLACCMHLDMKMIPLVQGILDKGAQVFLTTCNPTTVQDDVVAWLVERGAEACAWRNMSDADWQQSWEKAIAWQPTHLCEMGADITTLLHQRGEFGNIVAGLEATGSGVNRLGDIQPGYPIFNWDDLPVKEGLHNRHMVGLTAWHTFFQTTHLTLHEKKVLVIGYGLVGQGVAALQHGGVLGQAGLGFADGVEHHAVREDRGARVVAPRAGSGAAANLVDVGRRGQGGGAEGDGINEGVAFNDVVARGAGGAHFNAGEDRAAPTLRVLAADRADADGEARQTHRGSLPVLDRTSSIRR